MRSTFTHTHDFCSHINIFKHARNALAQHAKPLVAIQHRMHDPPRVQNYNRDFTLIKIVKLFYFDFNSMEQIAFVLDYYKLNGGKKI